MPDPVSAPRAGEAWYTPAPRDVGVEITSRCQLRCRHCFNHSGPERTQELPLAVVEGILDEARSWGVDMVRLSGGEPTAHRDFRAIVEAARERGIRVALNSHGVYAPELLTWLSSGPVAWFLISLDGMEANHDALRGRGNWARALRSCEALARAGQRVTVAMHVGRGNMDDVEPLGALAAGLGCEFKVAPLRPIGRALDELPSSLLAPADNLAVVRQIRALRRRFPATRFFTDFDILDASAGPACAPEPGAASCKAGRSMVNVHSDGRIYPCAFFVTDDGAASAGSVYTSTVSEVWSAPETFAAFRNQYKDTACQSCGHYGRRCVGGCPAIAQAVAGRLDALDPTCFADLIPLPEVSS